MRRYAIFAVAGSLVLLTAINSTAVAVAFPVLVSTFDVSLIAVGWVLNSYQLAVTATIPIAGKISDALGRKITFIGFIALFTLGTLLCSVAPNLPSLIFFRVIQGLGGSGFIPSAAGIAADEFPKSRQRAVGLLSSILPVGWIIGPSLGGWLIPALGWRSIFWMTLPLCVLGLSAAVLFLPGEKRRQSRIDPVGSLLIVGSLVGLMLGISQMGSTEGQPPWLLVALTLGAGITCIIFFWRRQSRVKYPVIEPEVLTVKPFIAANVFNFLFGCANAAVSSLVPLYAVSLYGMSTLQSGLILTPKSAAMIGTSTLTSIFLARLGYRRPMLTGTIMMVPVLVLLAIQPPEFGVFGWSSTMFLVVLMGTMGLGQGMIGPAANNACIELMPHRIATISAMRSMFRQVGHIFAISIGTLLLNNYGIASGFQFLFLGLAAAVILVMVPAVFMVPRSAVESSPVPHPTRQT